MNKPARRRWWLTSTGVDQKMNGHIQEIKIAISHVPGVEVSGDRIDVIEAPHDSVILTREDADRLLTAICAAKVRPQFLEAAKEILEAAMKA